MQTLQTAPLKRPPSTYETAVNAVKQIVEKNLVPKVQDIDLKGEYPVQILRQLGEVGAYAHAVSAEFQGTELGLKGAIQSIEEVSKACLSTGFMVWCQVACTWYLQNTDNRTLASTLLPDIAMGRKLAGTGLSNPMKHFADIEKIALVAEPVEGGFRVNGMLPWVSNLGPGHAFGVAAKIADSDEYMMAVVSDDLDGMTLRCNAHFIALEGTGTFSCVFRDVFVPDALVLAAPCEEYVQRIRPGFILTQVGMGLGLVDSCIELMRRTNQRLGHVNCFLDDQADDLAADLAMARDRTYALADQLDASRGVADQSLQREVIQARILGSELSLKAAQATMLHAGARAYVHGSAPERKLREAYFVAIVTPALKHLKKMLFMMQDAAIASPL
jgi:alkylation response protein AidB-like acyl-CoA dehydrogenase